MIIVRYTDDRGWEPIEVPSNPTNVTVTGSLTADELTGSLTRLADGSPYLVEGANVQLTTESNGSVRISAFAPGGGGSSVPDGTAVGDILYWNGSAWALLPIGSSGSVLTSTGVTPSWATAPGGGGGSGGWTILDVQTTPKVISNTTVHTNIYNYTFGAGELTGKIARVRIQGTYYNFVSTQTGRLRVILGGETILDVTLTFPASSLRRSFTIFVELHALDATTHYGGGFYLFSYPESASTGYASETSYKYSPMTFVEPATVDSDASSTQLQVTWTHSTASPNLELRAETAFLEVADISGGGSGGGGAGGGTPTFADVLTAGNSSDGNDVILTEPDTLVVASASAGSDGANSYTTGRSTSVLSSGTTMFVDVGTDIYTTPTSTPAACVAYVAARGVILNVSTNEKMSFVIEQAWDLVSQTVLETFTLDGAAALPSTSEYHVELYAPVVGAIRLRFRDTSTTGETIVVASKCDVSVATRS